MYVIDRIELKFRTICARSGYGCIAINRRQTHQIFMNPITCSTGNSSSESSNSHTARIKFLLLQTAHTKSGVVFTLHIRKVLLQATSLYIYIYIYIYNDYHFGTFFYSAIESNNYYTNTF